MKKQEERMQILKMIETKQITSEEGMKLLDALSVSTTKNEIKRVNTNIDRVLKVRVIENNENIKVNVNVPIALIEVLADVGLKFLPVDRYPELKHIDIKQLLELIHSGINGKLVDVQAGDGTVVEVYVE